MGKKSHGPILLAAIQHNDFDKVREILLTNIKSKSKIQDICSSEVRMLASEFTEVPILLAASLQDPTIIKFMVLKQDVNINFVHKEVIKRKTKIKTPLIIAVRASLILTVEAILAMNSDPNVQDHKGRTALHLAVRKADFRTAKMLLSRGAQPNITDIAGNTPLHIATIFGHLELVKLLVRHEADLYKKGTGGAIPIHMAAKEGHSVLVRLFCQFEVNVNMKVPCYDQREKAPIHVAAEEGHADTVLVLLDECGADPNLRDSVGESPLHCSCIREYDPMGMKSKDEYTETTKILLQYGAHIDLQNNRGETPLHLAARNEFQKTVEVLVQAGSDPILEDNDGYKPYDLATSDDTVTIQILKTAMEERDRIMNDAMEIQAKGYSTSLMKQSVSSRSGLNMHSFGSNEFIIGPNGQQNSNPIYEDGYLQPVGLRSRTNTHASSAGSLLGKSQSTSSSGSKPSFQRNQKKSQSLLPQFRVKSGSKGSLHNLDQDASGSNQRPTNSAQAAVAAQLEKQIQNKGRSLPSPPMDQRQKNGRVQRQSKETEVSSFWDITPRSSVSTFKNEEISKSYESLPDDTPPTNMVSKPGKPRGRRSKQAASGKKAIQITAAFPNAGKIPGVQQKMETSDDDSFFDDESFDTLDTLSDKGAPTVPRKPTQQEINKIQYTPEEQRKIQNAVSNQSLHTWLEDQAVIMKKDGNVPYPPSTVTDKTVDVYTTSSEISSVSKARKSSPRKAKQRTLSNSSTEVLDNKQKPPPLPPKPGKKGPKPQPSVTATNQSTHTVIKVVGQNTQNRKSPVSETTDYTNDTVSYGQGPYIDSKMSTDDIDSTSIATESTIQQPVNKRLQHLREHNNNISKGKKKNRRKAGSTTTEDDENENWGNVPKKGISPQSKSKSKQKHANQDEDLDSSNSLSWESSDEETSSVGHNRQNRSMNSPDKRDVQFASHATTVPGQRRMPEDEFSKSLTDEYRFYKSVGDIQTASSRDIQSRMTRKYSEGDLLKEDLQHQRNNTNQRSQPELHNLSSSSVSSSNRARNKSFDTAETKPRFNPQPRIDEDNEQVMGHHPHMSRTKQNQMNNEHIVRYDTNGLQPLKLYGGNEKGIFVHAINKGTQAEVQGLKLGDEILKINNQSMKGVTKEEASNMLKAIQTTVCLSTRKNQTVYDELVQSNGAGDNFFVRTHFPYDASNRGEMNFKGGEIFGVRDTMPNAKPGMWHAVKMSDKPGPQKSGYIPNQFKAEQIATSIKIATLRAEEIKNKGGFIRKSFKRAKSLDRGMNKSGTESDEFKNAIKNVVAYERVVNKPCDFKRPVVLLGLFCDSVRDLLLQDLPDYFDKPVGAIELSTNAPNESDIPTVNVRPIELVMNDDKHCVVILSPAGIQFLQQRTQMNPMVIYLNPQNKAMVKSLKARFAPGFDRKPGFMYDEAMHFSKQNASMFTVTLNYTSDGGWMSNLKDTIAKLQNQPIWQALTAEEDSEDGDDSDEWDSENDGPSETQYANPALLRHDEVQSTRGRQPRISKTTDDIPHEIQNVLSRHIGATGQRPAERSQSVGDVLNDETGHVRPRQQVVTYEDRMPVDSPDEESVFSQTSQHSRRGKRQDLDASHSSSSSDKRPKKSILKNKSQSSLADDLSADFEEISTASSSGHRDEQQQKRAQPSQIKKPQAAPRAIMLQKPSTPQQQMQRPMQQQPYVQQPSQHQHVQQQQQQSLPQQRQQQRPQPQPRNQWQDQPFQRHNQQTSSARYFRQVGHSRSRERKVRKYNNKLVSDLLGDEFSDQEIDQIVANMKNKSSPEIERRLDDIMMGRDKRRQREAESVPIDSKAQSNPFHDPTNSYETWLKKETPL